VAANRPDLVTGAVTEVDAARHPLPDLPLAVLVLP
jgi:hypothetical protein